MKPARTIPLQDWMTDPAAMAIMNTLQGKMHENEPVALFVGGCVRNALLGEPVEDVDIATSLSPEDVIEKLGNVGIKTIPTGLEHGTITAVIGKKRFEITTLRIDVKTDGRRAVVSYTDDWIEDAKRRDFTVNTLLSDAKGNIYDPLQKGLEHIAAKKIIFVGNPEKRIEEDYLRILRYFRFHALYGEGAFDEKALKACKKAAPKIKTLARERIAQEFFKIIASDNPTYILETMFSQGILTEFDFKENALEILRHLCTFQSNYELRALPTRLYVLAAMNFENLKTMEQRLIFPKIFLKDMQALAGVLALPDLDKDQIVRTAIYRHGRSATAQSLMVELAIDRVMNGYAPQALKIIQNWPIPNFPINGEDIQKAGIKPGPELGQTLRNIENWWIENNFQPDRKECFKKIS
ncbi:MAG: CCA tRNA nucleotidyltransferase [Alphaproteobacteria bacterium]|nr:CCA tRNA nucleotidyltransferase [Alphaproteobacteria bacterium]